MTTGPGFYKSTGDGENILYALNSVVGPGFTLLAANQATYTYPVNGWTWYSDEATARAALALPAVLLPPGSSTPGSIGWLQFMALFTPTEQAAVALSTNPNVAVFRMMATGVGDILLTDPKVAQGLAALVSAGLITAARQAAIISGTPPV